MNAKLLPCTLAALLAGCLTDDLPDLGSVEDENLVFTNCAMKNNEDGGYDSALQFSSFWTDPDGFTMSAWIMPEYVFADEQPVFGAYGSDFWVGPGDFRARKRNTLDCNYIPVLRVHKGFETVEYLAPTFLRGTWRHLAMTWDPNANGTVTLRLYLDGVELFPHVNQTSAAPGVDQTCANTTDGTTAAEVLTSGDGLGAPAGTLRIGQGNGRYFYGLLDVVTVHNLALTKPEVQALAAGGSPAAGTTVWSNSFLTRVGCGGAIGAGTAVNVSIGTRDSGDAAIFADPELIAPTGTQFHLPWAPGEIWRVIQNVDTGGSHNGYAAFCWDFGKVGGSGDAIVRAAAPGTLMNVIEDLDPPNDELDENKIAIETATGEVTSHLHLEPGSVSEIFYDNDPPMFMPQDGQFTAQVFSEDEVARVGVSTGSHLHFGIRPFYGAGYTSPMAFSNYKVAIDCATGAEITATTPNIASHGCWKSVARGMPKDGVYLKR